MRRESVGLDVPEERIPKRASTEILEAERLDDLETCMVGCGKEGGGLDVVCLSELRSHFRALGFFCRSFVTLTDGFSLKPCGNSETSVCPRLRL